MKKKFVKTISSIQNASYAKPIPYPILLIAILSLLSGCEKFTQISPPKTQLDASQVYLNEGTAKAVLSNLYVNAGTLFSGSGTAVNYMGSFLADETQNWSTNLDMQQFAGNQMMATNIFASAMWQGPYNLIYNCNALLEGIKDNQALTLATRNQLQGEALMLRAYAHFYLTSFFGAVPLVITTDYRINTSLAPSSSQAVLQSVIADLSQAQELLPADYASYGSERIRPNSAAPTALLARVYLYAGDYQKSEAAATQVITNPLYGMGTLNETFLKNSKESILAYKPIGVFYTGEGGAFILSGRPTEMSLKPSFVQGFADGDQRRASWISKITATGVDYYFPFKYKLKTATAYSEYSVLLRLAEQYLIRAEARARLNKQDLALADLQVIRSRAGLAKPNGNPSQTEILTMILDERKFELFTEAAHRWFDLRRFGQIDGVIATAKPGWKAHAALLPIPSAELNLNHQLVQNPGY
ncbi:MAG: RagB/SusD family nutrient uptake outer membrane protein [Chitinophagaceae bacterium]|nr:MAG: RagB/SusD family nutrient uptake outer membrane protein [Chitinophagaceae bacterium]